MKIVRFSQNGHAPRLGCFLGQDRIADLEASLTEGSHVIRLDRSTGSQPITLPVGTAGVIELSGYGAAVVTNDPESGPGEERS